MNHEEKIGLFQTVFAPRAGERVLFLVDIPANPAADTTTWKDRRAMALEWFTIFEELGGTTGFTVSLKEYPATGMSNTPIPGEILAAATNATLVIAMTQYSASSSLVPICFAQDSHTRCASMPGVERRMEETALRADYTLVKQHATRLAEILNNATAADILFSTGDSLHIDLRFRIAKADTGECTKPGQFINFPSGEACKVPYEAAPEERTTYGESTTTGVWPVILKGEPMQWIVHHNRVIDIIGHGPYAEHFRQFFKYNPSRSNLAELGIGCNPRAVITGNVLEDEKVGLHLAYGMSTHLGGTTHSDIHDDICYSKGCPVEATTVTLHNKDTTHLDIIQNAQLRYDLLQ
jgi:leucyl aminopeptidase (aminopeptidase T)